MSKMNVLARRLVTLLLPVVAAISSAAPASAASSTPTRWPAVVAEGQAADGVTPLQLRSYISNETANPIGVSKDYVTGHYQALLLGHRRTDGTPLYWSRAVSFYVGPGYCVDAYYYQSGAWRYYLTVVGMQEYAVPQTIPGEAVARWALRNTRPAPC